MTPRPVVGNLSNRFSQILQLFTEFPVHHLPIVDAENKLIGIVSSNDLAKVFLKLGRSPKRISLDIASIDAAISVSDIMTPYPVSVTPDTPLTKAVEIFSEKKFLALPVVENGELVGILSVKDVVSYLAE